MHEQVYNQYEGHGDDVDLDLTVGIRASLEHQYTSDEGMRHRRPDSQWEHGDGSGVQRSASMRQPTAPSQLGRTSSMRHGGLRGFMREPMLEWVEAAENQDDPLLDEAGDSQRPSRFITEAIEEEEVNPQQVENPPQSERGGRSQTTSDT
ncbi:hypothetical protein BHE74_00044749 [Ensete ventricosum]|nr:hypothetical protein BHE74_00044749 [Ensete ventricosum]